MKVIAIVLGIISFVFFFQIYPNYSNPNELSRFLLVSAIVDDHTFQIDKAITRYGDTMDKAKFNGRLYCDKAIGYSMLAVLPYWILRTFLGPDAGSGLFIYVLRILINLTALGFFIRLLFRFFGMELELGARSNLFICALVFGTLVYPFSQLFLSHALAGLCLFAGFYFCCYRSDARSAFWGGVFLGSAFLLEFPSMITIAVVAIWMFIKRRSHLILFLVAASFLSFPQFLYNYHIFGHPLDWPQNHMEPDYVNDLLSIGYVGFSKPSFEALWGLTFSSYRGIFFYMPHLLFGLAGLLLNTRDRSKSLLALIIILLNLVYYSGFSIWDGGQSFGSRYLVCLIPFLIYGTAMLFRSGANKISNKWSEFLLNGYLILLAITIPNMLFGAITFPYSPRFLENPILWQNVTMFWRSFFGLNWGEYMNIGERGIQVLAILFVTIPVIICMALAMLSRGKQITFALVLFGFIITSWLFQPAIQSKADARYCMVIGRTGYIQGHYKKALEFIGYSLQRTRNPGMRVQAENLIQLIYMNIPHEKPKSVQ